MLIKRQFGNLLQRLLWVGTSLSRLEYKILLQLVSVLPPHLCPLVQQQLNSYNLAQREYDDRAINFYRMSHGRPVPTDVLLNAKVDKGNQTQKLIGLSFTLSGEGAKVFHATLNAVNGRVFSIDFSVPIRRYYDDPVVREITESWRSCFPSSGGQ